MHTDHRQPPLRALGVLVLFVAITLLAMRTGLAAPQAQVEEPIITPTPGIEPAPTPTPVEPIISPLPTSTPEPDFR